MGFKVIQHRAHEEATEGSSVRQGAIFWIPLEFKLSSVSGTAPP